MSLRGTAIALAFTLGYAAACGMKIIEATANGLDVVEWPSWGEWKEWMWAYVQMLCHLTCSLLVAAALTWWSRSLYWIPMAVVMFVVFPYVVLSAMEAESWLPLSTNVPRTLKSHAWAWGVFYGEAVLLIAAWSILTVVVSVAAGSAALVVTSPLLAALMIIYARLLGRLGWVISR
jgi:hypothetical protein